MLSCRNVYEACPITIEGAIQACSQVSRFDGTKYIFRRENGVCFMLKQIFLGTTQFGGHCPHGYRHGAMLGKNTKSWYRDKLFCFKLWLEVLLLMFPIILCKIALQIKLCYNLI